MSDPIEDLLRSIAASPHQNEQPTRHLAVSTSIDIPGEPTIDDLKHDVDAMARALSAYAAAWALVRGCSMLMPRLVHALFPHDVRRALNASFQQASEHITTLKSCHIHITPAPAEEVEKYITDCMNQPPSTVNLIAKSSDGGINETPGQ